MTLGELIDRVLHVTGLDPPDAMRLANELWQGERDYTNREIAYAASKIATGEPEAPTPEPEMTLDPAEVLAQVYKLCPRVLCQHVPRLGRAPKDSRFFREQDVDELLAGLPDETKLLIGAFDLVNGRLTITMYDEANDLDRDVGPLDLARYRSSEELDAAIRVLVSRLQSRVLPADFNQAAVGRRRPPPHRLRPVRGRLRATGQPPQEDHRAR
jgi:hypothetical protein